MALNIHAELKRLGALKTPQLKARYAELFGEPTRCNNRPYLIKRIAWRLQADAEGDLSERARQRAAELADDADLRLQAPSGIAEPARISDAPSPKHAIASLRIQRASDVPLAGSTLWRTYKGKAYSVIVLPKGFECEGKVYRSLSAVANAITGSHWNGAKFFEGAMKIASKERASAEVGAEAAS
jgi:hypothetical protein